MREQKLLWTWPSLLILVACSTAPHVPPAPVVQTRIVEAKPSEVLLELCADATQIPTRFVRDIQKNRDLAKEALAECRARQCRLVQWFKPETRCDTDALPPSQTPTASPGRKAKR